MSLSIRDDKYIVGTGRDYRGWGQMFLFSAVIFPNRRKVV